MSSLRRRLTISLWIALVAVGLICAAFSYVLIRSQADTLLDYQMEQIAQFVAAQSLTVAAPAVITPHLDLDHDDKDGFVVTVRDDGGRVLYASRPASPLPQTDWLGFGTVPLNAESYRLFSAESDGVRIAVAQQIETRQEAAEAAALSALLPVGVLLPVLGLIIGLVIRRELQPLRDTAAAVAQRRPFALEPLAVGGLPDEVRPLIEEINRLLLRQRAAVEREQHFLVDAVHALRTPLSALQLQADVLEGASNPGDDATRRAELRAGIRRVVRLAEQLIMLARSEPAAGLVSARIALDVAAADTRELYLPSATTRGIRLELDAHSGATVPGSASQLALLIGNLLDNACRYTPQGGRVRVSTRVDGGGSSIEVQDEGPGLPESELEKVFERFHRAPGDPTEGSGLGLAVVRSVATRLGGRAWIENRMDRRGLIARVWLPGVVATPADREARVTA